MQKLLIKGGITLLFCDYRTVCVRKDLKDHLLDDIFFPSFSFFSHVAVQWATLGRTARTVSTRISAFKL